MSSPLEQQYRRVLRLLPATYRARWEEDMVNAFLESSERSTAATGRPTLSERLSVVALAVRLRLNGSYAGPRRLVWHQAGHALAVMVLLYQAVAATASLALGIAMMVVYRDVAPPIYAQQFSVWSRLFGVLWVAAFVALVLGRMVAARVLVLLAAASAIGTLITIVAINGPYPNPLGATDLSRWGWLAMSVLAVWISPSEGRVSRPLWLSAYGLGSLLAGTALVGQLMRRVSWDWPWIHYGELTTVASVALIVTMLVALIRVWPDPSYSARWLLALAAVAGGISGVRLLTSLATDGWSAPAWGNPAWETTVLDVPVVGLALACAVAGLLRWRRVPAEPVRDF